MKHLIGRLLARLGMRKPEPPWRDPHALPQTPRVHVHDPYVSPLPSPCNARWRRWSKSAQRARDEGWMLPPLPEEPCWRSPTARAAREETHRPLETAALVRSYVQDQR
ncbi:hypothetical protein OG352_16455 [Streptomyces sp. NBC_01485]|uniref:hypothetical protein n=1 Tax=Streptomyces sp. NBC_01485 TaxID=2903884 RepID=UPI002E35AE5E|nr:hypothetical protein [Streptomyces sp. NBC_01485]